MKTDNETVCMGLLALVIMIIAICLTTYNMYQQSLTVDYAAMGLQECQKKGSTYTLWQKECE